MARSANSIDQGRWNLQGLYEGFYNNSKGDDESKATWNSWVANTLQTAHDADVAKDIAQFETGLGQSNMLYAADLQDRNAASGSRSPV